MRISDWSSDVCSSDLGTFARSRAMRIVHGFEIHPRRALLPGLRQTVDIEPLDTVEPWREQGTWRQLGTRFGCRMAEHHAAAAPPPTVQLRLGIGQLALGAGVRQSSRSLQRMWDERDRKSTRLNSSH